MRPDAEEQQLLGDPRLAASIDLFNAGEWYAAHDGLEELWHETAGPCRPVLQGILQIAVSQLHRERGNRRGALILMGEGLGRLRFASETALGLDLRSLISAAEHHLQALQQAEGPAGDAPPALPKLQLRQTPPP